MNILLITSEDNGPHFGCYGDPFARTPHIDRLASAGTRFTNAYVTQAVCSPGRASILTGLYPHQNGQIGLSTHAFRMYRDFPSIPSLLKQAGYRTGRIGKLHVEPKSACPFDFSWKTEAWRFKQRETDKAIEQADAFFTADEQPFFLMMNFVDAHLPWLDEQYGYPEELLTADDVEVPPGVGCTSDRLRAHTASYYNCINRLDDGIGLLLDALERSGKADDTLVVYITDHGPQFSRGKCCINELALRAPLLLRWPGVSTSGTVRHELVSQIDILPTVLDAAGIDPPPGLPGASLRPLAGHGAAPDWRQELFAEWTTSHPFPEPGLFNPQRCVRDQRFKLILNLLPDRANPVERYYTEQAMVETGCTQEEIDAAPIAVQDAYDRWRHQPPVELYDLQADPWEYVNLADNPAYSRHRDRLLQVLDRWQVETHDALADPRCLERFTLEHEAATKLQGGHKQDDFRWGYLDYFAPPANC